MAVVPPGGTRKYTAAARRRSTAWRPRNRSVRTASHSFPAAAIRAPAHPGILVLLLPLVTGLSLVGGEVEDRTAGPADKPGLRDRAAPRTERRLAFCP